MNHAYNICCHVVNIMDEFLTTARHDETCLCSFDEFKIVKDVG